MWFLNTETAELSFFAKPEDTRGYAIVSHTWDQQGEQSFQEVMAIIADCKKNNTIPREHPRLSEKIRNACILAKRHGYNWLWLDACCIDKTSSSELSEAINSMFSWYYQAEVCYAYLADVPYDSGDLEAPNSPFRTSRYHTRGWTLQELIAPSRVIFYSKEWRYLGTKRTLCTLLHEITHIWSEVLEHRWKSSSAGIAARMYWASKRRTTRIEDEAYCLMGLFGVNMPVIYGEGRRAFQRLQLEIMKDKIDTSLFTWGAYLTEILSDITSAHHGGHEVPSWQNVQYLLAPSPSHFQYHRTYYSPFLSEPLQPGPYTFARRGTLLQGPQAEESTEEGPSAAGELPRFSVTNYGMECRFPIIESDGYTVAVLLCERGGQHIGLLLHRSPRTLDPTRPLYYTSACFSVIEAGVSSLRQARTISLGADLRNLTLHGKPVEAYWKTIHIVHSPELEDCHDNPFFRLELDHVGMVFRIPHWLIGKLSSLGFTVFNRYLEDTAAFRVQFNNYNDGEHLYLDLGACDERERWAKVHIGFLDNPSPMPDEGHDCNEDHVANWPAQEKRFGDSTRGVRLSLLPKTLITVPEDVSFERPLIHLELTGCVYETMLREAHVIIPTREDLAGRTTESDMGPNASAEQSSRSSHTIGRVFRRALCLGI